MRNIGSEGGESVAEYEYEVTAVTFGLGLQSGSTRTMRLSEHVREVAADGWRLVSVNQNMFEFPIVWRCFWERPARPKTRPKTSHPDTD